MFILIGHAFEEIEVRVLRNYVFSLGTHRMRLGTVQKCIMLLGFHCCHKIPEAIQLKGVAIYYEFMISEVSVYATFMSEWFSKSWLRACNGWNKAI